MRRGQHYFNVLSEWNHDAALHIQSIEGADPFYIDDYIPVFFWTLMRYFHEIDI